MRADGKNWLTYTPPTGISKTGALDFSWLNDGPVGKHGHVTTKDGHFVFEDGTPVKFFGVNLGFEIARPDKKVAEEDRHLPQPHHPHGNWRHRRCLCHYHQP